jgi:hypothetical protein
MKYMILTLRLRVEKPGIPAPTSIIITVAPPFQTRQYRRQRRHKRPNSRKPSRVKIKYGQEEKTQGEKYNVTKKPPHASDHQVVRLGHITTTSHASHIDLAHLQEIRFVKVTGIPPSINLLVLNIHLHAIHTAIRVYAPHDRSP